MKTTCYTNGLFEVQPPSINLRISPLLPWQLTKILRSGPRTKREIEEDDVILGTGWEDNDASGRTREDGEDTCMLTCIRQSGLSKHSLGPTCMDGLASWFYCPSRSSLSGRGTSHTEIPFPSRNLWAGTRSTDKGSTARSALAFLVLSIWENAGQGPIYAHHR